MTLTEHQGDLFTSTAASYGHGVNIKGLMGAGIAKAFREHYPDMYESYKYFCDNGNLAAGECYPFYIADQERWIYNISSQDEPGPAATLPWLVKGMSIALLHAQVNKVPSMAIPRIGCGIGGLDWEQVHKALTLLAKTTPVDIEVWSLPNS